MKKFLLLPFLLMGCATGGKLDHQEKMLASYPINIKSEDFDFSELVLLAKLNHQSKQIEKCHGLFPNSRQREDLVKLYVAQKSKNSIKYEKRFMLSLINKHEEFVLYHVAGTEDYLEGAIKACERLMSLYSQDGYKVIDPEY